MELPGRRGDHLTYCTNIHPANGWEAVWASLREYALPLKRRLCPGGRFGIGLRLSAREAEELLDGGGARLREFRAWLREHDLYVALINGFPYGPFHRQRVKEAVFAPDWRSPDRLEYTRRLATILAELLPEGMEGGISTCPLSYKGWIAPQDSATWEAIADHVLRIARELAAERERTGRHLHLDLEPEPDGLVETTAETIAFFERWLIPRWQGNAPVTDYVQLCYDACHMAVEYEHPDESLGALARAGIRIGRVQISSALRVALPDGGSERERIGAALLPFAESTYLHQVIERRREGLRRYRDLPDALPHLHDPAAREWRIHYHVPIFLERYDPLASTQGDLRQVLAIQARSPFTRHLEIETYTWEVLPPALKGDLLAMLEREFRWVLGQLSA